MSTDDTLFQELDKYSGSTRQAAKDLAVMFGQLTNKPVEIHKLIMAFEKLHDVPIAKIDEAILEVKKAYDILLPRIDNNPNYLDPLNFDDFTQKNIIYYNAISGLLAKAETLESSSQLNDE